MKKFDYLYRLLTPVYGTQMIPVEDYLKYIQKRLEFAKDENDYFNSKYKGYNIAEDEKGELWLVGWK